MPNNPHHDYCHFCGPVKWSHLRMCCPKCGATEDEELAAASGRQSEDRAHRKQVNPTITTVDTLAQIESQIADKVSHQTVKRTTLRSQLNEAIKKAHDEDLRPSEMAKLTGLSKNVCMSVFAGDNVSIAVADDFIAGMQGVTKDLLNGDSSRR